MVIDEPSQGDYFGGLVAAQCSRGHNALRLLQVTPDDIGQNQNLVSAPRLNAERGDS